MSCFSLRLLAASYLMPACLIATSPAATATDAAAPATLATCTLAIHNASVLTMRDDLVLPNHTVRLAGDQILSVLPTGDTGPVCETERDVAGLYLMPGLNDLHGHIETTAFAAALGVDYGAVDFPDMFAPYPRYGITGIRILSGAPDILQFAASEDARHTAPMIVTSGPMLSGNPAVIPEPMTRIIETESAAREAVQAQARAGYDLIKIRANLSPDVYAAVVDEATRLGLHVDGHLQRQLDVADILRSGQSGVAHLFDLTFAVRNGNLSQDALIEDLLECGCYVSTTIGVLQNLADQLEDYPAVLARPEMDHMHPMVAQSFWLPDANPTLNNEQMPPGAFFRDMLVEAQAMTVALVEAGVPVLLGSDALNPMLVHGTAVHDELDLLIAGGLTRYQALRTGTVIPSEVVPGFETTGVVAAGYQASLLLLTQNPLLDHTTIRSPHAVVLAGRWLDDVELQDRVDAAVSRYPAQ